MESPSVFRNLSPPQEAFPIVVRSFTEKLMEDIHLQWEKYKLAHPPEIEPEHDHWDWTLKRAAAYHPTLVGLQCEGQIQGLMLVEYGAAFGRSPSTAHLPFAYVSYVEAAPWNVKAYAGHDVRFLGVGTALISLAVQISEQNGWAGRVALHSLPSAHRFYLSQGFLQIGYDEKEGLDYFELSAEGSATNGPF